MVHKSDAISLYFWYFHTFNAKKFNIDIVFLLIMWIFRDGFSRNLTVPMFQIFIWKCVENFRVCWNLYMLKAYWKKSVDN